MCSSEQPQVVQHEVHQFRESRSNITPAFARLLTLALLPSMRYFQIWETNRS